MSVIFTTEQKVLLHVTAKTAAGNATSITDVPVWSVDNPDLVVLAPAEDGLSCEALGNAVGLVVVMVSSMGLTQAVEIEVVAPTAVSLDITADEPTLK